jgi:hypothetical protein
MVRSKKSTWDKLNRTYEFLVYADDVNLLGHNINTIKKNAVDVDSIQLA